MKKERFYYHDADLEGDPAAKARRDEWRRGDSPAQRKAIMNAKATMRFIREHPGCHAGDIGAAGISPNFHPLVEHGLAHWTKDGRRGIGVTSSAKARWWPNTQP